MNKTVRCRISGTVQGVGYRQWTRRTAVELGLSGQVKNQDDGTVSAVLTGAAEQVDAMLARCGNGPPAARVKAVEILSSEEAERSGSATEFAIAYE